MIKRHIHLYTGMGEIPDVIVRIHSVRRKRYRNSKQIDCTKRRVSHNKQILSFINNGGIEL